MKVEIYKWGKLIRNNKGELLGVIIGEAVRGSYGQR
jgi:hypothetical protein